MSERATFFRQSGWMVLATTLGGIFMWLVHVPAARGMSPAEYGVFVTLLQIMNLMMIPAMGLQIIFAQQTAAAVQPELEQELASTVREVLLGVFVLWGLIAGIVWVEQQRILTNLKIPRPAALWLTVGIGLAMLWWPVLQGVLQGKQNFTWLGLLQIVNGVARFSGVLVFVTWLRWGVVGAMTAAFLGFWLCVGLAVWQTAAVLFKPGRPVRWRAWLSRAIPLSLGLGATQFMMAADQVAVQRWFPAEVTGFYGAAGMIGRALIFFTVPLVAVMFPKVVRSTVLGKRTPVVALALGVTVVLGGSAALGCTLFPKLPLQIVYEPKYLIVAPLVPWFAWCMLPLTVANVLVGLLLARGFFRAVPWLVLVAVGYGVALAVLVPIYRTWEQMKGFLAVVQTLGVFSLLLAGVAGWFAYRAERSGVLQREQVEKNGSNYS